MSSATISYRALEVLAWMGEVDEDPRRCACFLNGTLLANQAIADGIVGDESELEPLVNELIYAGYITATITRRDQ